MSLPIYILHPQRDEIVGSLTNEGQKMYWDEKHVRDLRTGEDIFSFTTPSMTIDSGLIVERSRLVIPADTEGFNEFVVFNHVTTMKSKRVTAVASYIEMEKSINVIPPGKYTGTLSELMDIALPNTRYQKGYIEFSGVKTLEFEEHIKPYTFIKRLSNLFDTELNVRLEVNDNVILGRFIDHLRRIGEDTEKEVRYKKDLIDAEIEVDSDSVVTGLYCVGPEREDGTQLTTYVFNEEARQRWNTDGEHLVDIYSPESDDQDMTLEELIEYGTKELNKRIASVYNYRFEVATLEHIYGHERMTLGDRIRVINDEMDPPLYTRARIVRLERTLSLKRQKIVEIGEVIVYKPEDIERSLERFRKAFNTVKATKTSTFKQATKPSLENRVEGDTWYDSANGNKILVYNKTAEDFVEVPLDHQALAVGTLSAITANLGTVTAGSIIGVSIDSSTFTSSGTSPYGEQMNLLLSSGVIRISTNEKGVRIDSNTIRIRDFLGLSGEHDRFFARLEDTTGNMVLGSTTYNPDPSGSPFPGGPVEMELQPNFNYEVKIKNGLRHEGGTVVTTQEETGYCAVGDTSANTVTTQIAGVGVNFKMNKTYIPSSIDFDEIASTAPINFIDVTERGFYVYVNGNGVSGVLRYWRGHYTA